MASGPSLLRLLQGCDPVPGAPGTSSAATSTIDPEGAPGGVRATGGVPGAAVSSGGEFGARVRSGGVMNPDSAVADGIDRTRGATERFINSRDAQTVKTRKRALDT